MPSQDLIVMLQGALACGGHDEYTIARVASARHCARLLMGASRDAKLLVRSMRCYGFLSPKREISVYG